jgi:hypothetical protein
VVDNPLTSKAGMADRTRFAAETTSRNATNPINLQRKCNKIDDAGLYPPAHNGLVAGSSPAGPPSRFACFASHGSASQS